jgi:hypothetical protein
VEAVARAAIADHNGRMKTPSPSPRGPLAAAVVALAIALGGCAAAEQRVDLQPPVAAAAGVQVLDSRQDTTLKVKTSTGTLPVDVEPPVAVALRNWIAASYTGPQPFYVGLQRLEVEHQGGLTSGDELSCTVESQVRVGGEVGRPVRTRVHNNASLKPDAATAVQLIVSQCLEAHARDINAPVGR